MVVIGSEVDVTRLSVISGSCADVVGLRNLRLKRLRNLFYVTELEGNTVLGSVQALKWKLVEDRIKSSIEGRQILSVIHSTAHGSSELMCCA